MPFHLKQRLYRVQRRIFATYFNGQLNHKELHKIESVWPSIIQGHLFTFRIYSDVISHNTRVKCWIKFLRWNLEPLNKHSGGIIEINIFIHWRWLSRVISEDDWGEESDFGSAAVIRIGLGYITSRRRSCVVGFPFLGLASQRICGSEDLRTSISYPFSPFLSSYA